MERAVPTPEDKEERILITRRNLVKGIGAGIGALLLGGSSYKLWEMGNSKPTKGTIPIKKDPATRYLEDTPELSYGFSKDDYKWGKYYVDDFGTEFLDSHPEFHETLNSKIKQEGLILREKFGQNYSDVADLVNENWKYHYKLWDKGNSLLPLDTPSMVKDFPDREDRDVIYRGMWMDEELVITDALTGGGSRFGDGTWEKGKLHLEILERNLNAIFDGTLYKRVMDVFNNPDSEEFINIKNHPELKINAHQLSRQEYDRVMFRGLAGFGGWHKTTEYFKHYDEEFKKDDRLDKLRFLHGFAISVLRDITGAPGQAIPYLANIYSKALGDYLSIVSAEYPGGTGEGPAYEHDEPAYAVPIKMIEKFKSNPEKYGTPLIGRGQTISFYSTVEGLKEDGSEYLDQKLPDGELIRLFDLSK